MMAEQKIEVVFQKLKRDFGESAAKIIRDKLPMLEEKGEPSKIVKTTKSVKELFNEAGYDFFECKTQEDIFQFSKYYKGAEHIRSINDIKHGNRPRELPCTFPDIEERLENYHVFWLVKKNVDEIKRNEQPLREDDYSTSVLTLQFFKKQGTLDMVVSRYNNTISNPGATYGCNLENICKGLTFAFEKEYGLSSKTVPEIDKCKCIDGKYYYLPYENYGIHYGDGTVCKNGKIIEYPTERYAFFDGNILSLQDHLQNQQITKIEAPEMRTVGDKFLRSNIALTEINLPNLQHVGNDFLYWNANLTNLNLPKLQTTGNNFLCFNTSLKQFNLDNLHSYGTGFLYNNPNIADNIKQNVQRCNVKLSHCNNAIKRSHGKELL